MFLRFGNFNFLDLGVFSDTLRHPDFGVFKARAMKQ
jgi:hypothetical protein